MFRLKHSPRWRYRKCYFILSVLSISLIIFYCTSSHKLNLMLLTFFNCKIYSNKSINNDANSDNIGTNIQQNLTTKHVDDSNKQLRDWHINTHTHRLQVTRDHLLQTVMSNHTNNQQRQQNSYQRQAKSLSLDAGKFIQIASANSTYTFKLIEYINNNNNSSKNHKNNNNNNSDGDSNSNSNSTQNINYYKKKLQLTGFNVELSQSLPLERLIPDTRHKSCKAKLYPGHLPHCSVIIIYYNEHASVLLRSLYSLIDRTPSELLKEIILVDDYGETNKVIEEYIRRQLPNIIKQIRLPKREGLIRARLKGAEVATGEVLVFLDAHIEVNENWLPALLAPLVEADKGGKTCTTPIIDVIKYDTLEYEGSLPSRGGFNWDFNYVQLPLLEEEKSLLPQPHINPIMNGGLFAIWKEYFWLLGGYDEGLEIWGAEQFELSFKIWMCGGRLLEVPCSRVGHLYRDPEFRQKYTDRKDDFISKNYKRVAEVWMDEYKEYLYEHIPKLNQIDAGNLSEQKLLRKTLNCKSFKWFLHNITPDLLKAYPPLKPSDFAFGAIQSLAVPKFCIDLGSTQRRQILKNALKPCSPDLKYPYAVQKFHLTFRHDLRHQENCLEVQTRTSQAPIWLWPCHNKAGNQYWQYDRNTQMLIQGKTDYTKRCLEMDRKSLAIFLNYCNFAKSEQKWLIGYINQTAMDHFFED